MITMSMTRTPMRRERAVDKDIMPFIVMILSAWAIVLFMWWRC